MSVRSIGLALLISAAAAGSCAAVELPPDTARARAHLMETIMTARVPLPGSRVLLDDGHPVRFEAWEREGAVFYLFLNQAQDGRFPVVHEGNVSIKRSLENGRPLYMTFLLRRDSGSYVRLRPWGDRVRVEVFLYGAQVEANVMLPLQFEQALDLSLARLVALTAGRVDWSLLTDPGHPSAAVAQVLASARRGLTHLGDEDDGAFDSAGRPVFIATGRPSSGGLNCSGFAKWVIDGFYHPLTGRYMEIGRLKARDLSIRGNRWSERYEGSRDPFFGLDWTRNMAVELHRARTGRAVGAESFDVRDLPYLTYIEDVGYPIGRLELALFLLARQDPDRIFLGSINEEFGKDPVLRQHTHVVVLFPQFDAGGQFHVSVLERNLETGLEALIARHAGSYIHLVEIPAAGAFEPMIPAASPR